MKNNYYSHRVAYSIWYDIVSPIQQDTSIATQQTRIFESIGVDIGRSVWEKTIEWFLIDVTFEWIA
jgi:hypothetical protein